VVVRKCMWWSFTSVLDSLRPLAAVIWSTSQRSHRIRNWLVHKTSLCTRSRREWDLWWHLGYLLFFCRVDGAWCDVEQTIVTRRSSEGSRHCLSQIPLFTASIDDLKY
jgi:hypothetical protein